LKGKKRQRPDRQRQKIVASVRSPCHVLICLRSVFRQHNPSSPAEGRRRRRRVRGPVRGDSGSLHESPCTNPAVTRGSHQVPHRPTPCFVLICLRSVFRQHSPSSPAEGRRRRRRVPGEVGRDISFQAFWIFSTIRGRISPVLPCRRMSATPKYALSPGLISMTVAPASLAFCGRAAAG